MVMGETLYHFLFLIHSKQNCVEGIETETLRNSFPQLSPTLMQSLPLHFRTHELLVKTVEKAGCLPRHFRKADQLS